MIQNCVTVLQLSSLKALFILFFLFRSLGFCTGIQKTLKAQHSSSSAHSLSIHAHPGSCRLQPNPAQKGDWQQKVLRTATPMRCADTILHKNTLCFIQNSLAISDMIRKHQDSEWEADVHTKMDIFSKKIPNFAQKQKRMLQHTFDKLFVWVSP